MNFSALNGEVLNGQSEVYAEGSSEIVLQTSGALAIGLGLVASSEIVLQTTGAGFTYLFPTANSADVVLATQGEALYGRSGSGESQVVLASDGEGVRRVMGAGDVEIVLASDGDAQVVGAISGISNIQVQTEIEERITPAIIEAGASVIRLETGADEHVARSVRLYPEPAELVLASVGEARAIIYSMPGNSILQIKSDADARLGAQVYAPDGESVVQLYTRAALGIRHYVYGSGASVLEVLSWAAKAGIPPRPTVYVPAPRSRTITVARDPRDLPVPRELRAIG